MFDVSWIQALVSLTALALAVAVIRRALGRARNAWRKTSPVPDNSESAGSRRGDWAATVIDRARGSRPDERA